MEERKMDESEWRYHREGNKSLVMAHLALCSAAFSEVSSK
jgi:hypothetical protein